MIELTSHSLIVTSPQSAGPVESNDYAAGAPGMNEAFDPLSLATNDLINW